MPLRNTYHLIWVSLMWGISSWLLQQSAAVALYLGQGVSPHCRPSRPSMWNSSSRPSSALAATTSWTWGRSSQPPPLASGGGCSSWPLLHCHSLALLATAPDLGRGVAPLGCPLCTVAATHALVPWIYLSVFVAVPYCFVYCRFIL